MASLFFGSHSRALRSQRLAHANSIARMANPAGIMRKAGPGNTTNAMPTAKTVPPSVATMMRLIFFIIVNSGNGVGSAVMSQPGDF